MRWRISVRLTLIKEEHGRKLIKRSTLEEIKDTYLVTYLWVDVKFNNIISIIMELRAKTPIREKYEPDRHSTITLPLELQHKERSRIGGLSALTLKSIKKIKITKKYIYNIWGGIYHNDSTNK